MIAKLRSGRLILNKARHTNVARTFIEPAEALTASGVGKHHTIKRLARVAVVAGILAGSSASSHTASADWYYPYHYVADVLGTNPPTGASGSINSGYIPIGGVSSYGGSDCYIDFTVWDEPGSSQVTSYRAGFGSPAWDAFARETLPATTETSYRAAFGATQPGQTMTLYAITNPFGSSGNRFVRKRNFRAYFQGTESRGPKELIYSNVVNGAMYSSLPSTTDVNTGVANVGFRGFATPYSSQYPFGYVYFSLQQPNGSFWSGTAWGHQRINFIANFRIVNSATGRVEWSKVGGLPTGANLPNGQYILRTMARQNAGGFGPGLLNMIAFNISKPAGASARSRISS